MGYQLVYMPSYKRFYNEQKMVKLLQNHLWRCAVTFVWLGFSKWMYCSRWKIRNIMRTFNPLMPDVHYIIINTWRNLHLKVVGLFNYVWPFIGHQAIKGYKITLLYTFWLEQDDKFMIGAVLIKISMKRFFHFGFSRISWIAVYDII